MKQTEVYDGLDAALLEMVEGYTIGEVLERLAAVVRSLPAMPDRRCPGGTLFSQKGYHNLIADTLEDLAV